jgi:hypothetical protein
VARSLVVSHEEVSSPLFSGVLALAFAFLLLGAFAASADLGPSHDAVVVVDGAGR